MVQEMRQRVDKLCTIGAGKGRGLCDNHVAPSARKYRKSAANVSDWHRESAGIMPEKCRKYDGI
jgi:hypothetical protein